MLLLEARKDAGEWCTGSLLPNFPCLLDTSAQRHVSSETGTWMMPLKHRMMKACIFFAQRRRLSGGTERAW